MDNNSNPENKWRYRLVANFENGASVVAKEGLCPCPQPYDLWLIADDRAANQNPPTKVKSIDRVWVKPMGEDYETMNFTIRPSGPLTIDAFGHVVCSCGELTNPYYVIVPELICWKCGKNMHAPPPKLDGIKSLLT